MKGVLSVFSYLRVAIAVIIPLALLAESKEKPGAEKRVEVVERRKGEMQKLGLTLPSWLGKLADALLGILVDVVVEILNRTGFFTHGEEPLAT